MTQIHIIDRQTDKVLEDIQIDDFWGELRTRNLNGLDIFDFVTFANKEFSQYLKGEKGLIIPAREGGYAEFIIKENKQNETRDRYIFSEGSFLEIAKKKIIEPGTYTGTPQQLINLTMNGIAKWKVGNVAYAIIRTIQVDKRITAYQMLKRIAEAFEYELKFRFEVNKGKITRFVDLVEKIGVYRGHEIELGHNMKYIERHENTRDLVTALNVFGPPDENGNRKHVFVYDDEAKERWSTDGDHLVKDYYPETFNTEITEERLRTLGNMELNKRVNAIVSYTAKMVDLGEDVHFGDEVRVKDEKFVPPLYLEARIHTMREDLKGIVPTDVDFGDFVELSVEDAFANFRKMQEEMAKKIKETEERLEPKIPEQPTTPDPNNHPKWVDTSKNPPQLMLWDGSKWTTVKGDPGKDGEDGRTSYPHFAYANSADGKNGFSVSDPNRDYIGMYVDFVQTGSTNPDDYRWTKTKGLPGGQGIPGAPGEDGRTPYFHTAYANSEDGTVDFNITDSTDRRYMGHYTDYIQADSNDPSKYKWTPLYDNVKVGGRNLLINSTWNFGTDNWQGAWNETYQILEPESDKPSSRILQILSASATSQKYNTPFLVEVGKEYTVSVDIKVDEVINSTTNLFAIRTFASLDLANSQANSTSTWYPFRQRDIEESGKWQRLSFTFTADDKWLRVMPYNSEVGKKAYFREIMVEESNIPMPWQEAPEDTQAKIDEAKQDAKNAQTSADGKNTVFYQTSEPSKTGRKANDIWFDTDNGFKMHRFDGSNWVEAPFGNAAFSTIDAGKIVTGILKAIDIEGVNIKSNTTIDVTTDLFVGNNIYLGKDALLGRKSIDFFQGNSYIASEYVNVDGFTRNRLSIVAAGTSGIVAIAGNEIQLAGTNIVSFLGQSSEASIDITGGDLRLRQSPERYITVSKDGRFYMYNQNGLVFNLFDTESAHHKFLRLGSVGLKFLNGSSEQVQVRNSGDTRYVNLIAANVSTNSTRESKTNIHPYEKEIWNQFKNHQVYSFVRKGNQYEPLEERYQIGHMKDELPAVITTEDAVELGSMAGYHTKIIQECMAKIEALENRVDELEGVN